MRKGSIDALRRQLASSTMTVKAQMSRLDTFPAEDIPKLRYHLDTIVDIRRDLKEALR